ncbi:HvfC/BufC family peptide modification chaperone [Ideonella sp. YS5]|uniref:HvfC/BufC family peptide modification chaperone n=1 Tax=Ideonella sp. YS5 TaxID=3453714 RepID=UPI003EEC62E9
MSLADQQRAFAALLDAAEPAPDGDLLRGSAGRPARLDVYHHAYRARLVAALRSNYPVLHHVLGDEAFRDLALAYLADHPSRRPSIRWFGDELPAWASRQHEALPHPALADLAAMEWALGLSFDAADARPATFAELATLPAEDWPGASFAAHPSVGLLNLEWAVEPIWRALTDDEEAASEEPQAHAHTLLVWRQGLETRWRSVEPEEADALAACLGGEPFAALCAHAAALQGDAAPAWVASALRRWVDDGLLVRR